MASSKKRTVNFSAKEVGILMSLVLKYKSTIECRKTDKTNNDLKQKAWEQLSQEFNSICGEPFRDAKVLRGKYENQKKRSKQKFADEKVHLRGTGGGPKKPKIFDDIDEKVKDIIGTQMTGFDSEFDGDCKYDNMQRKSGHDSISDSASFLPFGVEDHSYAAGTINFLNVDPVEETVEDPEEEDSSLSEVTSKRKKTEHETEPLQATYKSTPSCSTSLPIDWTKMTPDKLRTPKSKPLKTILKKASGIENKNVLSKKITLWASNKAESAAQQRDYLQEEHLLRIEMMKERHTHQMALDTKESEERIRIQAKKANLELEILQLQKEQLLIRNPLI